MKIPKISKEEAIWLLALIASMKNHGVEDWNRLRSTIEKQSENTCIWDSNSSSSLEREFSNFWDIIQPIAESIAAEYLPNISSLIYDQMKRELQIGCIAGLSKFDVHKSSGIIRWLARAWIFQDNNVRKRKTQQPQMFSSVYLGEQTGEMPIVDSLSDGKDNPRELSEKKDLAERVQEFCSERISLCSWRTAIAIWLDDAGILDEPEDFPKYSPRARQYLIRELAHGPLPSKLGYESTVRTNVFFRRHLWKKLSESKISPHS